MLVQLKCLDKFCMYIRYVGTFNFTNIYNHWIQMGIVSFGQQLCVMKIVISISRIGVNMQKFLVSCQRNLVISKSILLYQNMSNLYELIVNIDNNDSTCIIGCWIGSRFLSFGQQLHIMYTIAISSFKIGVTYAKVKRGETKDQVYFQTITQALATIFII